MLIYYIADLIVLYAMKYHIILSLKSHRAVLIYLRSDIAKQYY